MMNPEQGLRKMSESPTYAKTPASVNNKHAIRQNICENHHVTAPLRAHTEARRDSF